MKKTILKILAAVLMVLGSGCQLNSEDYISAIPIPGIYTPWPHGSIPSQLPESDKADMINKTISWLEENNKTFWGILQPADYINYRILFNSISGDMDSRCSCITGRETQWSGVKNTLNRDLELFTTHGEMLGAFTRLTYVLNEGHTSMIPDRLAGKNCILPGAPVIVAMETGATCLGAWVVIGENDDIIISQLTGKENPYRFSPGDRIVAVNGIPFDEWRTPLEDSSLPILGTLGGNSRARELNWLKSIMINVSLFEYITVERISGVKETLQIVQVEPRSRPVYETMPLPSFESGSIMGGNYPPITAGKLENINIGYIKINWFEQEIYNLSSWKPNQTRFSQEFKRAVKNLSGTEGLIIDIRGHSGGMWQIVFAGWALLTENKPQTLFFRAYEKSLGKLITAPDFEKPYRNEGTDITYNHPIIILTDSHCISGGDFFTALASRFSHVTILGEAHNGSFCGIIPEQPVKSGNISIKVLFTKYNWTDLEGNFLLRENFIDEYIQYNRNDIIHGEDTYLKRAIEIINS